MYSRRFFFARISEPLVMVATVIGLLPGCRERSKSTGESNDTAEPVNCDDLSGASETDMAIRKKLSYVNESPIPENQCDNCNLFLPIETAEKCGGCMLFKGPVYKSGYCTYWAPRV